MYKATIKVWGKDFEGKGETIREAIASLKPGNVKGMGILTLSKGKKSKDRVLTPPVTFRLFSASPTMREIALKQTALMFDRFDI